MLRSQRAQKEAEIGDDNCDRRVNRILEETLVEALLEVITCKHSLTGPIFFENFEIFNVHMRFSVL